MEYTLFFIIQFILLSNGGYKVSQPPLTKVGYINLDYLNCIQDSLPCECGESLQASAIIILDTNKISESYGLYLSYVYELVRFDLSEDTLGSYKVVEYEGTHIDGFISLKNDTLYYISTSKRKSTYIRSKEFTDDIYEFEDCIVDQYEYLHGEFLNREFIKRGHPSLKEVFKQNSLSCGCFPGLRDVLSGQTKSWLIRRNKNYIEFYDYTIPEELTIGKPIKSKKLFKKFRW